MARYRSCLALLFLPASLILAGEPSPPPPTPAAAIQLLREVEQRFTSLQSLRYQVTRTSQKGRQSQTERWIFAFSAPDRLRIDYQAPQERLILINADEMWEYIPSLRQALKTDLKPLASREKTRRLAAIMARVSIDGLHPGSIEAFTNAIKNIGWVAGSNAAWRIEGQNPRFTLVLDPDRKTLQSAEIFDTKERLTLRTEATEWREVLPGYWFPQRIRATYPVETEFVISTVQLEGIEINRSQPDALFTFTPPEGVQVLTPGSPPKR